MTLHCAKKICLANRTFLRKYIVNSSHQKVITNFNYPEAGVDNWVKIKKEKKNECKYMQNKGHDWDTKDAIKIEN